LRNARFRHLLQSAKSALDAGHDEKIVIACLLHDISNGALLRTDHGYWSAQLVAPYVTEAIHTLHNLLPFRGAVVRDANRWSQYLNAALASNLGLGMAIAESGFMVGNGPTANAI